MQAVFGTMHCRRKPVAGRRNFRVFALLEIDRSTPVDPEVSRHFRRNFVVNALDLTLFSFGDSFANLRTILPVFASTLTTSPFLIGSIPILNDIGWSLPQIFLSRFSARLRRKLPAVLILGLIERLPYLFLGWLAFNINNLSPTLAVSLLLVFVAVRSLISGVVGLPWQELIADIIPPGRRGSFFGTGFLMGQVAGIAGSGLVAFLLVRLAYPQGYAVSFFSAFAAMMVSWGFMCLTVEPAKPGPQPVSNTCKYGLEGARELLRTNQNFRRYLVSRGLYAFGFMAMAYLAVYALQRFQLSQEYAAIFSGVMLGGGLIGNVVGAGLSDRRGSKTALLFASLVWAAALLTALVAATWEVFLLVFILLGMSMSANLIADLSIAMDFSSGSDRPVYVGTARSVAGLFTIPTPFIAGLLVREGGYQSMLLVSLLFVLLSILVLWRSVRDPRHV